MQLGALLEELTVAKARAGIEKLVHLTPQTARILKNGREEVVPAEQVQIATVFASCPAKASRWMGSSSPDRPPSIRRS